MFFFGGGYLQETVAYKSKFQVEDKTGLRFYCRV